MRFANNLFSYGALGVAGLLGGAKNFLDEWCDSGVRRSVGHGFIYVVMWHGCGMNMKYKQ